MGDARTLCLLCRRVEISRAYYRYETAHVPVHKHVRITDHYNLVGVPGEYDGKDCMLLLAMLPACRCRSCCTCARRYIAHERRCSLSVADRMRVPGETEHSSSSSLMRGGDEEIALSKAPDGTKL